MPILAIAAIAFSSGLIQGLTGFGYALLAAPLLSRLLQPFDFIATLTLISLALNSSLALSLKAPLRSRLIIPLSLAALLGIPFGLLALQYLPPDVLRKGVALVVILLVAIGRFPRFRPPINAFGHLITGWLLGALQSSVGVNGPILVLYLRQFNLKIPAFRRHLAVIFLVLSLATIFLLALNSQVSATAITTTLTALPALFLGSFLGYRLSPALPPRHFDRLILLLILITAATTLFS